MTLRVAAVDDVADLQLLASAWNPLLERSASNTPFLTWEWVSTWWEIYGARSGLHVLTAHDPSGALVGLAPLKRARRLLFSTLPVEVAEFIGDGSDVNPEYLDFVIERGHEAAVVEAFADHLLNDSRVDGVHLRPLAADSANATLFQGAIGRRGAYLALTPEAACPVLVLPETYDAFLASRSRNYRKKIGEYERRGARELGFRVSQSASLDEVEADMSALVRLHHARWDGRSQAFGTTKYVEFHRRLAGRFFERGWLRLFSLEKATGPVALLYCFAYARRYYYYQAGRDPAHARHRVGLLLMHQAIRQAIEEGVEAFDFLRGREPYKYRWAHAHNHNARLVFWKQRIPGLMARAAGWLSSGKSRVLGPS